MENRFVWPLIAAACLGASAMASVVVSTADPDLLVLYEADAGVDHTGGAVATWGNLADTGSAHDATPSIGSPTWMANLFYGGNPGVILDGDDALQFSDASFPAGDAEFTYFSVFRMNTFPTGRPTIVSYGTESIMQGSSLSLQAAHDIGQDKSPTMRWYGTDTGSTALPSIVPGRTYLLAASRDQSNDVWFDLYSDEGGYQTQTLKLNPTHGPVDIQLSRGAIGEFLPTQSEPDRPDMDLGALAIYSGALSGSDRAGVLNAFKDKYLPPSPPITILPPDTMDITKYRQLFIDDQGVEAMSGLSRVVNQPTKHALNPLISGSGAWDKRRTQIHGTVIYREDLEQYQMWYLTMPNQNDEPAVQVNGQNRVPWVTLVGYATSTDGVDWDKPMLNQLDFNGSTANNLLDVGRDNSEGFAVLYEPDDPDPNKAYKAFFWEHRSVAADQYGVPPYDPPATGQWAEGIWVAYSPDGVNWTNHGAVKEVYSDSGQTVVWDEERQIYVAYSRFGIGGRRTASMQSADFENWSTPVLVFEADGPDGANAQVEGFSASFYEGRYLGLPWMRYNLGGDDWNTEVQLLISDDGLNWDRVADRQVFMGLGDPGDFDDKIIKLAHQPVVLDDRILIYYCGYSYATSGQDDEVQIGVAELRLDGWVSLEAGAQTSTIQTTPVTFSDGTTLRVNADASTGELRIALLDMDDNPIPGFSLAESIPITEDGLDILAQWTSGYDISDLIDEPFKVLFSMHDAKLFSYFVTTEIPEPATILVLAGGGLCLFKRPKGGC